MYPRTNYEMTEADLAAIMDACKPVPYMVIGGHAPSSPQENANRAWKALGDRMGFDHMTVRPIGGKNNRFFTAVPNETEDQRIVRLAREVDEQRRAEIDQLQNEIRERQGRLERLSALRNHAGAP